MAVTTLTIVTNGSIYVTPNISDVTSMHLIKAIDAVDELSFELHVPVTDGINTIRSLISQVYLTSDQGNFAGRVVQIDNQQSNDGTVTLRCEGAKGYLKDSWVFPGSEAPNEPIEEPYEEPVEESSEEDILSNNTRSNPEPGPSQIDLGALKKGDSLGHIISAIVSTHNAFVLPSFEIRYESLTYYLQSLRLTSDLDISGQTVYDAMNSIAEAFAIEWDIRWDGVSTNLPKLYVSKKFGGFKGELKTGINLGSVSKTENAEDLYTAILPLGGVGYDGKRLSLSSVACNTYNSGSIYISSTKQYSDPTTGARMSPIVKNVELCKIYGVRIMMKIYDNIVVNAPEEFLNKRNELLEQAKIDCDDLSKRTITYSVSAFDFENLPVSGPGPELTVYDYYRIIDYVTGTNVVLRLNKKDIDFDNLINPSLDFVYDESKQDSSEPTIIEDGITPFRPEPRNMR